MDIKKLFAAKDMTAGRPWKRIMEFAIPMLLGNLAQQLYNTADSVIVGIYIGDDALSAVGSASPILNLLLALFVGMLVGAYSSIFLATPLDVELRQRTSDIGEHTEKVLNARQERGDDVTTEDVAGRLSGQLVPGAHLGNQAQPNRKRAKRK